MAPRIDEEDYVTSDQFPALAAEGEWLRCSLWKEGHRIVNERGDTPCGRSFPRSADLWTSLTNHLVEVGALDEAKRTDWFVAIDRRKGSKCTQCKLQKGQPGRNEVILRTERPGDGDRVLELAALEPESILESSILGMLYPLNPTLVGRTDKHDERPFT